VGEGEAGRGGGGGGGGRNHPNYAFAVICWGKRICETLMVPISLSTAFLSTAVREANVIPFDSSIQKGIRVESRTQTTSIEILCFMRMCVVTL